MNVENVSVKRVLISVSDKAGIIEFARGLSELKIEIISTGGTSQLLRAENIPVKDISDITNFPEIMNGRVKTLHPKILGGILGLRDEHADVAQKNNIEWIDLVVVNLYPFAAVIQNKNTTWDEAIENIDIGGPSLIRAAAKNMGWTSVIVDTNDYDFILNQLKCDRAINFSTRKKLASKAFVYTAEYDAVIRNYLNEDENSNFPEKIFFNLNKLYPLRYGENPHQSACAYSFPQKKGILSAKQYQGKMLSYNNIVDADAAYYCVNEFKEPACVIVKHANPCGIAVAETIEEAYQKAFEADSISAFGGVIAFNQPCTKKLADSISKNFFEVIIAPSYTEDALSVLSEKNNMRVLELELKKPSMEYDVKFIEGGLLIQERDRNFISQENLKRVTQRKPTEREMKDLLFAWRAVKHMKSNAILIAKNNQTIGMGAGHVSRIDAVKFALEKGDSHNAVLASDGFFPFRDSIDAISKSGIKAIIQPGGSLRDEEVIAACDEYGIAMVFTGIRCFKH